MIPIKLENISYYTAIPLYIESSDGYVLYKKKGDSIPYEPEEFVDFSDTLYISKDDLNQSSLEVNKFLHMQLLKSLKDEDLKKAKQVFVDLVDNMLQSPTKELIQNMNNSIIESLDFMNANLANEFVKISLKDSNIASHSVNLGALAIIYSFAQSWSSQRRKTFALSAFLHDVGKISIPESILTSERRLGDSDFEIMKEHTLEGSKILDKVEFSNENVKKKILRIAEMHHEKIDGSGYPKGLTKENIPEEVQVLSIMDAYESLTCNDKPYRKSVTPYEGLKILKNDAVDGKYNFELFEKFVSSLV